jgi:ABC-type amino acid transport substrate-binding protein
METLADFSSTKTAPSSAALRSESTVLFFLLLFFFLSFFFFFVHEFARDGVFYPSVDLSFHIFSRTAYRCGYLETRVRRVGFIPDVIRLIAQELKNSQKLTAELIAVLLWSLPGKHASESRFL